MGRPGYESRVDSRAASVSSYAGGFATISDLPPESEEEQVPQEPCPRCVPLAGVPALESWEGSPCPTCGRMLPLPAGLPGGTVLTTLLSLRLLDETIGEAWRTARGILEDERLRSNLLHPIDPETPDARIALNHAEVPDPLTPAVEEVVEKEGPPVPVGVRRLLYALRHRRAVLPVILKEAFGAGFQRDEARVAARLGLPLNTVRLAVRNKKLVRV